MLIKNNFVNKVKMIFAVILILLVSVWLNGKSINNKCGFTPRLTEPKSNNKYYHSDLNLFYKYGYGMPNCTAYAYGRAYEVLKTKPKLCPNDAGDWFEYNKTNSLYPYGQKPRIGAIVCFDNNNGGHVAMVEKIEEDKITFSNSGYGYKNFYLTFADINDKNVGNSQWDFQGYIYIVSNF